MTDTNKQNKQRRKSEKKNKKIAIALFLKFTWVNSQTSQHWLHRTIYQLIKNSSGLEILRVLNDLRSISPEQTEKAQHQF